MTSQSRTLAEEIYHPVFEIIRETAPDSFAEIQRWRAERISFNVFPVYRCGTLGYLLFSNFVLSLEKAV